MSPGEGVRIEEMLELTHHSFVAYTLPTTGEVVPMLQVAPSKTDAERLLLVSPELAEVLTAIIFRVRSGKAALPLVSAYDVFEQTWCPPMPFLFQRRFGTEDRPLTRSYIRECLVAMSQAAQITAGGQPLEWRPHDFRRIFVTDAIRSGLPPHIAAKICGHSTVDTTMGYAAIYPEDVIAHHRAFIARRRAERPSEEYRELTATEWDKFLAHPVDCTTSRSMTGPDAWSGGRTWYGRGHAAGVGRRAAICPSGGSGDQGRDIRTAVRGRGRRWRSIGAGRRVLTGSHARRREPIDVPQLWVRSVAVAPAVVVPGDRMGPGDRG